MIIQWYPGHMAKAKRMIQAELKIVDGVLEVVDARLPLTSRNPEFQDLTAKPCILVLSKTDLADPSLTAEWANFWRRRGEKVVTADLLKGTGLPPLQNMVKSSFAHLKRNPRLLVVGIPNVGKSTLINRLAKRKGTSVGARPGVTRGKQWLAAAGMELLDSPGVLWPKFTDQSSAKKLAAIAAIRDEAFDQVEMALWLLNILPVGEIRKRYGLVEEENLLEAIGRRRGYLLKGGLLDLNQTAAAVLKDFRTGKLGRITLDGPPGDPGEES